MRTDIGQKIKELRTSKKLTLQEVADATGFSTGFLSQLERGLTTVAVDSLAKIAATLGSDLNEFIAAVQPGRQSPVTRSYERPLMRVENNSFIHYLLSRNMTDKSMAPRLLEILPSSQPEEEVKIYPHAGEEFVFVLEGVLTLFISGERHELYPGDSAHYLSTQAHNFANNTSRPVKVLLINTPNFLNQPENKPAAKK